MFLNTVSKIRIGLEPTTRVSATNCEQCGAICGKVVEDDDSERRRAQRARFKSRQILSTSFIVHLLFNNSYARSAELSERKRGKSLFSLKICLKNALSVPFSSIFRIRGPALCGENGKNRIFRGRALGNRGDFKLFPRFF